MIPRLDGARLAAPERAALIYAQARADLSGRLWKAALGESSDARDNSAHPGGDGMGLDTLMALLGPDGMPPIAVPPSPTEPEPRQERPPSSGGGLGANAGFGPALAAAAERTGLPAPALAAIVQAEAASGPDGRWLAYSRNPRSSAAGLGQFLGGTWIGEAERPGTWLHETAAGRGWLDGHGRVRGEARSPLLALRYDGEAAIQAIADYARANLTALREAGVATGGGAAEIARTAYVGHHLGLRDAARFLTGGLDPGHAAHLLRKQIGDDAAAQRIAAAGDAAQAHRQWLTGYLDHAVRPERFAGAFHNYGINRS